MSFVFNSDNLTLSGNFVFVSKTLKDCCKIVKNKSLYKSGGMEKLLELLGSKLGLLGKNIDFFYKWGQTYKSRESHIYKLNREICEYKNKILSSSYKDILKTCEEAYAFSLKLRGNYEARLSFFLERSVNLQSLEDNLGSINGFMELSGRKPKANSEDAAERTLANKMYYIFRIKKYLSSDYQSKIDSLFQTNTISDKIDHYIELRRKLGRKPNRKSQNVEEKQAAYFRENLPGYIKKRKNPLPSDVADKVTKFLNN